MLRHVCSNAYRISMENSMPMSFSTGPKSTASEKIADSEARCDDRRAVLICKSRDQLRGWLYQSGGIRVVLWKSGQLELERFAFRREML
jgi:hypothetical protein